MGFGSGFTAGMNSANALFQGFEQTRDARERRAMLQEEHRFKVRQRALETMAAGIQEFGTDEDGNFDGTRLAQPQAVQWFNNMVQSDPAVRVTASEYFHKGSTAEKNGLIREFQGFAPAFDAQGNPQPGRMTPVFAWKDKSGKTVSEGPMTQNGTNADDDPVVTIDGNDLARTMQHMGMTHSKELRDFVNAGRASKEMVYALRVAGGDAVPEAPGLAPAADAPMPDAPVSEGGARTFGARPQPVQEMTPLPASGDGAPMAERYPDSRLAQHPLYGDTYPENFVRFSDDVGREGWGYALGREANKMKTDVGTAVGLAGAAADAVYDRVIAKPAQAMTQGANEFGAGFSAGFNGKQAPAQGGIDQAIASAAQKYGVPEALLRRLVQVESNGDPSAVGKAGERGLTQIMPGTAQEIAAELGYSPEEMLSDPAKQAEGGAYYLRKMRDKFGSWEQAVSAYQGGPGNLQRAGGDPSNMSEFNQGYVGKYRDVLDGMSPEQSVAQSIRTSPTTPSSREARAASMLLNAASNGQRPQLDDRFYRALGIGMHHGLLTTQQAIDMVRGMKGGWDAENALKNAQALKYAADARGTSTKDALEAQTKRVALKQALTKNHFDKDDQRGISWFNSQLDIAEQNGRFNLLWPHVDGLIGAGLETIDRARRNAIFADDPRTDYSLSEGMLAAGLGMELDEAREKVTNVVVANMARALGIEPKQVPQGHINTMKDIVVALQARGIEAEDAVRIVGTALQRGDKRIFGTEGANDTTGTIADYLKATYQ